MPGCLTFVATDWVDTGLLIVGASLNLVGLHRWRGAQARGLQAVLAR